MKDRTGLAIAARLKGYRLVCTVPDRLSPEKINQLKAYGAKVILTPSDLPPDHPGHYRKMAERIAEETPDSFMPNQYFNEANPLIHYRTTGPEIWEQTGGKVDVLVAGMGTGGIISGAGGSAGAAVSAALRIASSWASGLRIVIILPDDGRNYLSRFYSDDWMRDQGFLDGAQRSASVAEILSMKPFRFRQLQSLHPGDPVRKAITLLMANDILPRARIAVG